MMLTRRPHNALFSTRKCSRQPQLIGLIALSVLLMTPACSGSSSSSSQTMPTVSVIDNMFSPKVLHIQAGQTVLWVNKGQTTHTVTADDNSFDSGELTTGTKYLHTFTKPGRYPYYCQIHGGAGGVGMAGVIIVDSSASTAAMEFLFTIS